MEKYDLIIIGGGPAGLTAAIYGQRAGLSCLVLEKTAPGGQTKLTDMIENWPGTLSVNGFELGSSFKDHALHLGAEIRTLDVKNIRPEHDRRFVVTAEGEIEAGAIIVATGSNYSPLGVPGEAEFTGRGVSYCAVCDGPFYRRQSVAVVGGGDSAVKEAEYLTAFADRVYLIHRRDQFRAGRYLVNKVLANPKISPIMDTVVNEIHGDASGLTHLSLKNKKSGQESRLDVSGVFIFVGLIPHSGFLGGLLETTEGGWIVTDRHLATSRPGIFAAGDVRETDLRQVVTAAADGARAAMNAYNFLEEWDLIKR